MLVPWRYTFNDCRALGIHVGPGHEQTVNEGGKILILQSLASPGCYEWYGDFLPAKDMEENPMHVASLVDAAPTTDLEGRKAELISDLDLDQMDALTTWPSYIGMVDEQFCGAPYAWSMDERPQAWRFWTGVPVDVIGMPAAVAIVEACQRRIEHSHWEMCERYASLLEEVGMPVAPSQDPNVHLSEEEIEILDIEDTMHKDGIWAPGETGDGQELPYESMDMLLDWNPVALKEWKRLLATSRQSCLRAARSIPEDDRAYYIYMERSYDPWL